VQVIYDHLFGDNLARRGKLPNPIVGGLALRAIFSQPKAYRPNRGVNPEKRLWSTPDKPYGKPNAPRPFS